MSAPAARFLFAPEPRPYRPLFLTGLLLAWAGVLHWALLGLGVAQEYRSIFHALTQIQGVMMAFAAGFLFTFLPRRTGAPSPPRAWVWGVVAALWGTATAAWFERWAVSQLFAWAVPVALLAFAVRCKRHGGPVRRAPPPSFSWVPVSLVAALGASVAAGMGGALGGEQMWLHDVGRAMLLQGVFTGLCLGVGGFLVPLLTRAEGPDAVRPHPPFDRAWAHGAAALLYFASFALDVTVDWPRAFALRALVTLAVVVLALRLYRRPTEPGLHRWLVWLGMWALPLGNACVALFPEYKRAGLHVLFLGGFGVMAFSVASHVWWAHGPWPERARRTRWPTVAMALCFGAALGARVLLELQPERFSLWLTAAAVCFLAATVCFALGLLPPLRVDEAHLAPSAHGP